ncbi:MAG: hypothetical protein HQK76_21225 [Desulfobacterales bacterium]|nr:hypothetical protein [Desulfobacterales bacterium]
MPSIKCKCGHKISYGEIPNPNELLIISDIEFDALPEAIDVEQLYKQMKSMLQCNKCNRLWYFNNGFENDPIGFVPDD